MSDLCSYSYNECQYMYSIKSAEEIAEVEIHLSYLKIYLNCTSTQDHWAKHVS